MANGPPPIVLITGVSGYIGSVVAAYALAAGYRVRGTVRDPTSKKAAPILKLKGPSGNSVELVAAELDKVEGWAAAVKDVTFILHVASPVPTDTPKDADAEVIQPAIKGVLNVLTAASNSTTVKRVVLTSSIAAVNEGRIEEWPKHTFNEDDWSNPDRAGPYPVSKTRAEQAAWSYMAEHTGLTFDLAVINPGLVVGPPATDSVSSSTILYTRLFGWGMPAVPDLVFCTVDVRDVALAHMRAMVRTGAGGRRHILVAGNYSFRKLAADLDAEFRPAGCPIPTWPLPSWIVRFLAYFDGALSIVAPMLGAECKVDNSRARAELGITFRDVKSGSIDGAYGLLARGVVTDSSKGRAVGHSLVPVARWLDYSPAPAGTGVEKAGRYAFTMDELGDAVWKPSK